MVSEELLGCSVVGGVGMFEAERDFGKEGATKGQAVWCARRRVDVQI